VLLFLKATNESSSSPRGGLVVLHSTAALEPALIEDQNPSSWRSKYQALSEFSPAESLLAQLASDESLLKLDNNIPALIELNSYSTEELIGALSNLILEGKLGDNPNQAALDLVALFPLQDISGDEKEKEEKRSSIQELVRGFLGAIPDIGLHKSEQGVHLNLNEISAEANLRENDIKTTLIQRLNKDDQTEKIVDIALVFNKRIVDNNDKSPYLKAFLEKAGLLISLAANDSTFTMQRTHIQTESLTAAQRLAQDIDSEEKITFTEKGMTAMITALSSFNEQYAREHDLKLLDKPKY
jgi:hypothetical protein